MGGNYSAPENNNNNNNNNTSYPMSIKYYSALFISIENVGSFVELFAKVRPPSGSTEKDVSIYLDFTSNNWYSHQKLKGCFLKRITPEEFICRYEAKNCELKISKFSIEAAEYTAATNLIFAMQLLDERAHVDSWDNNDKKNYTLVIQDIPNLNNNSNSGNLTKRVNTLSEEQLEKLEDELTEALIQIRKRKDALHKEKLFQIAEAQLCSICIERGKKKILTPCGHAFCGECADALMKNRTCPNCRKPVTGTNPLYL